MLFNNFKKPGELELNSLQINKENVVEELQRIKAHFLNTVDIDDKARDCAVMANLCLDFSDEVPIEFTNWVMQEYSLLGNDYAYVFLMYAKLSFYVLKDMETAGLSIDNYFKFEENPIEEAKTIKFFSSASIDVARNYYRYEMGSDRPPGYEYILLLRYCVFKDDWLQSEKFIKIIKKLNNISKLKSVTFPSKS